MAQAIKVTVNGTDKVVPVDSIASVDANSASSCQLTMKVDAGGNSFTVNEAASALLTRMNA